MNTEQNTGNTPAAGDVDGELLESGYVAPLLTVVAVYQEPAPGRPDNLRVEVGHGDWITGGDLAVFTEAAVRTMLRGSRKAPLIDVEMEAVSGGAAAAMKGLLVRLAGDARGVEVVDGVDPEQMEHALVHAEKAADACAEKHAQQLEHLRGLIADARAAKDTHDRANPPGEDLADAAQDEDLAPAGGGR